MCEAQSTASIQPGSKLVMWLRITGALRNKNSLWYRADLATDSQLCLSRLFGKYPPEGYFAGFMDEVVCQPHPTLTPHTPEDEDKHWDNETTKPCEQTQWRVAFDFLWFIQIFGLCTNASDFPSWHVGGSSECLLPIAYQGKPL